MDIFDLKQRLGVTSFEERFPGLADTIRESQEAKRRVLSGPTIADLYQARMDQVIENIQKESRRIQEQTRPIFSDEKE